jgi:Tfp pilus assembly protein PilZ
MQILKVRFRSDADFLTAYQADLGSGGLFCPTTTELEAGAKVICEVTVPSMPNKVMIRGVVRAWRPALPRLRVRAGATVEFDRDESDKRDFLLGTVKGERGEAPRRRKHMRLPVVLPVRWRTSEDAEMAGGDLSEISIGGALLQCPRKLTLGTDVIIEVVPPGGISPIDIAGTVTYHTPTGAMGVKFQYRDGGGSRRLRELVRRLRAA